MDENPYKAPRADEPTVQQRDQLFRMTRLILTSALAVLFTIFATVGGGGFSLMVYYGIAIAFESTLDPRLSRAYGQFYVLIMLPLAGLLGSLLGASVSTWLLSHRRLASFISILGGSVYLVAIVGLWVQQATSQGVQPSDVFMYPPLILPAVALVVSGIRWVYSDGR